MEAPSLPDGATAEVTPGDENASLSTFGGDESPPPISKGKLADGIQRLDDNTLTLRADASRMPDRLNVVEDLDDEDIVGTAAWSRERARRQAEVAEAAAAAAEAAATAARAPHDGAPPRAPPAAAARNGSSPKLEPLARATPTPAVAGLPPAVAGLPPAAAPKKLGRLRPLPSALDVLAAPRPQTAPATPRARARLAPLAASPRDRGGSGGGARPASASAADRGALMSREELDAIVAELTAQREDQAAALGEFVTALADIRENTLLPLREKLKKIWGACARDTRRWRGARAAAAPTCGETCAGEPISRELQITCVMWNKLIIAYVHVE